MTSPDTQRYPRSGRKELIPLLNESEKVQKPEQYAGQFLPTLPAPRKQYPSAGQYRRRGTRIEP